MASPKILLVNDDGIRAPGLGMLEQIVGEISDDVWVVAPAEERSGAGHSITLTTPIRARREDERHVALSGTPADCVIVALDQVLDGPPDLVVSGINLGANVGEDVHCSGTCGAAMEAALRGLPTVALSQDFVPGQPPPWETARRYSRELIELALDRGIPDDTLWCVNFPPVGPDEVAGLEVTTHSPRSPHQWTTVESADPRGGTHYWLHRERATGPGIPGSDLAAMEKATISLCPLSLRMAERDYIEALGRELRPTALGGGR